MREYKIKEGEKFVLPGGDVLEGGQIIRLGDYDAKQHANKLENPPADVGNVGNVGNVGVAAANAAVDPAASTKATGKKK